MVKFNKDYLIQIINNSGLTQVQFAAKFGFHKGYLNELVCGRRLSVGFEFFSKMYLAGYNINDFFEEI